LATRWSSIVRCGDPVCVNCGAFTVPASVLEKVELQAAVVAFADALRVTGGMLRFARKALGLTQTELAARLSVSMESVSRWEREERPMEPWVPLAVLGLVRERLVPCPEGVELRRMG
jgi:DNA-binding transcriptional regulator YiaG